MQPRILPLVIVAAAGVALSVALVIFGFPESTPGQTLALTMSALPLSVSVGAGDLILLMRAQRQPSPAGRWTMIGGGILSGIGLIVMVITLIASAQAGAWFGQFMVFVGLLAVMLVAIPLQGPAKTEWFSLEEVADTEVAEETAAESGEDAEADATDPGASL